jgi:hypothetical protein
MGENTQAAESHPALTGSRFAARQTHAKERNVSDMPKSIRINEEGPREGFQIERGEIPTARKVELIATSTNSERACTE